MPEPRGARFAHRHHRRPAHLDNPGRPRGRSRQHLDRGALSDAAGAARQSGRAAPSTLSRRIRMTRNACSYASRVTRRKREPWSSAAWKRARRLALWRQPRCRCGLPATDVHQRSRSSKAAASSTRLTLSRSADGATGSRQASCTSGGSGKGWEPRPPRPGSRRVWPGALGDDPLGTGKSDAPPGRIF
jgi:hypothetical protein